eukprot:GHVL01004619.1.p3 GENE.GHVL01004619.1~~GHVL01004619.1.p3  ORF type:complete len:125 (-),score=14.58 GHVL01004619.1:56-430(-)
MLQKRGRHVHDPAGGAVTSETMDNDLRVMAFVPMRTVERIRVSGPQDLSVVAVVRGEQLELDILGGGGGGEVEVGVGVGRPQVEASELCSHLIVTHAADGITEKILANSQSEDHKEKHVAVKTS